MMNRPRRNRRNEVIRSMVRESHLLPAHLIAPLFVIEGTGERVAIKSMPGQFRFSIDELVKEAKELFSLGIHTIAIFPAIDEKLKTPDAREAYNPQGLNARTWEVCGKFPPRIYL